MGMSNDLALQWEQCSMRNNGLCCTVNDDVLIWNGKYKMESVSVKDIYTIIISHKYDQSLPCFLGIFWKTSCPKKSTFSND